MGGGGGGGGEGGEGGGMSRAALFECFNVLPPAMAETVSESRKTAS